MPTRQRSKLPADPPRAAESRSASASETLASWIKQADLRELATGAFVVTMLLVGSEFLPGVSTQASDMVVAQVLFELPMALLALCAGQAIRHGSRAKRMACVTVGLCFVALAGSINAVQLETPWAMLSGAWLLAARAAPPRGIDWFSVEHCRAIEVTASTAWACLIGALALLILGNAMTPSQPDSQSTHVSVYVIAWGAYYLSLGLLLPHVRRQSARPRRP